jgi:RimJ/RimL family protein N-acetyltransferase
MALAVLRHPSGARSFLTFSRALRRLRTIETENSRNRRAARIGSTYSSTWPAGGEPVRTQHEGVKEEWTAEHAAGPVVKELTTSAERKLFADFRGVPPFVRKATGQAEPPESPLESGSYAASCRRVAVDAIDQEPWRRPSKPRALSDAERKRIDVFYSQRLLGALEIKGGGISIRPLDPAVDLVQVMDTMRADADADANADIAETDEWLAGLVERPSKAAGQWAAAAALRTNLQEGDASALYSIVDEVTSRSVGVVSLRDDAPEALRVEIARIVLPRSLCCSAVLLQCLRLLLEHIFEKICYTRVKVMFCLLWVLTRPVNVYVS